MDIKFLNHASLLLQLKQDLILTDPWYISPAFGGWSQYPSPNQRDIRSLISTPQQRLNVIISHGHDDHLDEFFIKKHLKNANFFIPKFKTDGLRRRIEMLTGKTPYEVTEAKFDCGEFELQCFINPNFTNYDAIFTIKSENSIVIHANDNWHEYPEKLSNSILEAIEPCPLSKRYFFIQFGIADCFPLNYPNFDKNEALQIINNRFEAYYSATTNNLKKLGIERGFYYANQSIYQYPPSWNGPSIYEMAQDFLKTKSSPFIQCTPGLNISKPSESSSGELNLFDFLLRQLEKLINSRIHSSIGVQLLTDGSGWIKGSVGYEASRHVWTRILNGELTLESIIIGGLGFIHRPDQNISEVHHKVSKLSYYIQDQINQHGLNFLMELE